jgi:hypothetical protein
MGAHHDLKGARGIVANRGYREIVKWKSWGGTCPDPYHTSEPIR